MKIRNSSLILLIIFLILIVFLYTKILIKTPFLDNGDVFEYMALTNKFIETHSIKSLSEVTGTTSGTYFPIYSAFPFLFILSGIITIITGLEIPYIMVLLNLLIPFFLSLSIFIFSRKLFNNSIAAFINAIFYSSSYHFLYSGDLVIIFFLLLFTIILKFFESKSKKLLILITPLLTLAIFSHHFSFIFFGLIFLIFLFTSLIIFYNKIHQNKKLLIKKIFIWVLVIVIPFIIFFCINFSNLNKLFSIGVKVAIDPTEGGENSDILISKSPLEIIFHLDNPLLAVLILTGLIAFLFAKKSNSTIDIYRKIFVITALTIGLLASYQHLFGFSLYQNRSIGYLGFIISLFLGYGMCFILKKIKKPVYSGMLTFILIIFLISPNIIEFTNFSLLMNWDYINSALWVRYNIDKNNAKFISDPATLFMFQGIANIEPAYQFSRPTRNNRKELIAYEPIVTVFQQYDPKIAFDYLKSQDISYIIVDTHITPAWALGDIEKFNNKQYFQEIYSSEYKPERKIKIYKLKNI